MLPRCLIIWHVRWRYFNALTVIAFSLLFTHTQAIGACVYPACDPNVATITNDSGLFHRGVGTIRFRTHDHTNLDAWTYRSSKFSNRSGPIWFIIHGASRTAESYLRAAAPIAERESALAVAIHFPYALFPKSDNYTLGVVQSGSPYGGEIGDIDWRRPQNYLYQVVESLFDAIKETTGNNQNAYYLFGHSGGAQFVHRLVTFMPQPRVEHAVAANAGWYTMPSRGAYGDINYHMPYGLRGSPITDAMLSGLLRRPMSVLLGSKDTRHASSDPDLRATPEAMAQGATRYARGNSYMAEAEAEARRLGVNLAWRRFTAPGAYHDKDDVLQSAAFLLFDNGAQPCASSSAAAAQSLEIVEIHADPADGAAGDVNRDGQRDPAEDEFLEFVNSGTQPICLAGWTIGDAGRRVRHLFPIGRSLQPGDVLVLFGGGVPTGSFGDARVQWATSGRLSLSNAGDVLTMRDSNGQLFEEISWGDCDDAPCAQNHLTVALNRETSAVRRPGTNTWSRHDVVSNSRASPGTLSFGSP